MSGDDGLRDAFLRSLRLRGFVNRQWRESVTDELLALPEVAELRAKAAAADRARELADDWAGDTDGWYGVALRCALDGGAP